MDISYKIADNGGNGKAGRFNYRVAAIIESCDKILVCQHLKDGFSFMPGGRVKIGESALQAMQRELHEELDLVRADISNCCFLVENLFDFQNEIFHEIGLYFHLNGEGLTLPAHGHEQDDIRFLWIGKNDLADTDINLKPEFLGKALIKSDLSTMTMQYIVHKEI